MAPPDADGHEQINLNSIANLTIKDGQLYWRKEKLKTETRQKLVLSVPQKIGAVLLSATVSVAAIISPIIQYTAGLGTICPNSGYSLPYCETWKALHDQQLAEATKEQSTPALDIQKPPSPPPSESEKPSPGNH